MIQPAENAAALDALMSKADPARVSRAFGLPMQYTEWTGNQWRGLCPGSTGTVYEPRITLVGQRSFNCTCQDKVRHARQVGPCKHVISLALTGFQMLAQSYLPPEGSNQVTTA